LNLSSGDQVTGSFSAIGGTGNDVNFWITSPSGATIYNAGRVSGGTSFSISATQAGAYTLHFDNSFSIISSKQVTVNYNVTPTLISGASLSTSYLILGAGLVILLVLILIAVTRSRRRKNIRSVAEPTAKPMQPVEFQPPGSQPPPPIQHTNRFRALAAIGVLLFVIALPLPWLTINILGQYNISLLNIYNLIAKAQQVPTGMGTNAGQLAQAVGNLLPSLQALLIAIVIYPISVLLGILAIAVRKLCGPAGLFGILTAVLWIFGIESLKSALVSYVQGLGGTIGGSFASGLAGLVAGALASAVTTGTGVYAMIIGGILILVGAFTR
jgi:hypothetical protein